MKWPSLTAKTDKLRAYEEKKFGRIDSVQFVVYPQDGKCQSEEILYGSGINDWGDFSSWTYCKDDAAVCGLQTKVLSQRGNLAWEDDAGLTDIRLHCCRF